MTTANTSLAQHLKQHSQSLTQARRAVFAALQNKEPQTMQQLVTACGSIDRASVYRTVALFEKLGIVQRLQIGWKYKLELAGRFSRHHHHLSCLECGQVISFDESPTLERELRWAAASRHFKIRSHQLEIQGICQNCQL